MSSNPSGEKILGPKDVTIIHINKIKYDVIISRETRQLAGIGLDLPSFIPAMPKERMSPNSVNDKTQTQTMAQTLAENLARRKETLNSPDLTRSAENQFLKVKDSLTSIEESEIPTLNNLIDGVIESTRKAIDSTESLAHESDSLIRGPEQTLKTRLGEAITVINGALTDKWPDMAINEVIGLLAVAKIRLRDISDGAWMAANKARYDCANAKIDKLTANLEKLKRNEDRAKVDDAQQKLKRWRNIFADAQSMGQEYFTHKESVSCNFMDGGGEEKKLKITRKNRLDSKAESETLEVVTVVCSPLLSISAGVGFSALDEQDIAFVQSIRTAPGGAGTQALVNRFGFRGNSQFRSLPALLVNTRLHDVSDRLSIHASVGAAVDFNGQLGADAEFIVGPSLAFNRLFFITPGLHVGRAPRLAGGFQIGDEVPEGVDAPPIEKVWKPGFAVTFTIRIK